MDYGSLIEKALAARDYSYSPYSGFRVGAALLTKKGTVYQGCNIENAAYTPGICAERTAFAKAVSEGEREFLALAIAGGPSEGIVSYTAPCGVCRQVMAEFCGTDFLIILAKSSSDYQVHTLGELLPWGFGPGDLKRQEGTTCRDWSN